MARDYAARDRGPGPGASFGIPGWVWLVAGLSMGLVVAVFVYIGRPAQPMPLAEDAAKRVAARARPVAAPQAKEEPRFDFYELLEKEQDIVPAPTPSPSPIPGPVPGPVAPAPSRAAAPDRRQAPDPSPATVPAPSTAAKSGATTTRYLIVVGSFAERSNAEAHKAKLALNGIEASIEKVVGQDRKTWHRVRVGPEASLARAQAVQAQLKSHGFDGRVVPATR